MDDSDIIVRLIKLPSSIGGYTCPSFDGVYNVYINKDLPSEIRNEVIRHEIDHIEKNDFIPNRKVPELKTTAGVADP